MRRTPKASPVRKRERTREAFGVRRIPPLSAPSSLVDYDNLPPLTRENQLNLEPDEGKNERGSIARRINLPGLRQKSCRFRTDDRRALKGWRGVDERRRTCRRRHCEHLFLHRIRSAGKHRHHFAIRRVAA